MARKPPHDKYKCKDFRAKVSRRTREFWQTPAGKAERARCSERMKARWREARAAGIRDLNPKKPGSLRAATRKQVNSRWPGGCWIYVLGLDRYDGLWKVGVSGRLIERRIRGLLLCYPPDSAREVARVWIKSKPGDVEERLLCDFDADEDAAVKGEWVRSSLRQLLCRVRELRPGARWKLTPAGVRHLVAEHRARLGLPAASTTSVRPA